MKYSATIELEADEKLVQCFDPEDKVKNRSSYTISYKDGKVIFMIEAEDSVALRATLNTITKLLTVWEKT